MLLSQCKYVRLAKERNYDNYRMCSVSDLKNLGVWDSFTQYHKETISNAGAMVAIFNTINNKPASIIFRGVSGKVFMDYSVTQVFYGLDRLPDTFKYGDWLVLCEGIYDSDVLRIIEPNTIAVLTSDISNFKAEILKTITDKFIIAYDSDTAGDKGFLSTSKRLDRAERLVVYGDDKDIGVLGECLFNGDTTGYNERISYYKREIANCKSDIGFIDF